MRSLVFSALLLAVATLGFHALISASLAAAQDAKVAPFSERFAPALTCPLRAIDVALTLLEAVPLSSP
jgi:hypothetical protein